MQVVPWLQHTDSDQTSRLTGHDSCQRTPISHPTAVALDGHPECKDLKAVEGRGRSGGTRDPASQSRVGLKNLLSRP
eukprot:397862-Rhodomonas_salina.1